MVITRYQMPSPGVMLYEYMNKTDDEEGGTKNTMPLTEIESNEVTWY